MKKVVSLLIMTGLLSWQVPGIAGYHMTPRQAYYYHASKSNTMAVERLKAMGHSIDMSDENGDSALCEAVYNQDYSAFAFLKKMGATTTHPCVKKIPAEIIQDFNEGYAEWAGAVNAGNVSYARAETPGTYANTSANATTTGTTTVDTSTGLSTATWVGIGVGTAALICVAIILL